MAAMRELVQRFYEKVAPNTPTNIEAEQQPAGIAPSGDHHCRGVKLTPDVTHLAAREQAIQQMSDIANFFRNTEPSSPVPYLMERAARWATMSITEWLDEMLEEDDSGLQDIYRVMQGRRRE